jgi:hypothetical protein
MIVPVEAFFMKRRSDEKHENCGNFIEHTHYTPKAGTDEKESHQARQ